MINHRDPIITCYESYRVIIEPPKVALFTTPEYSKAIEYIQKQTRIPQETRWFDLEQSVQVTIYNMTTTGWLKLPILR